MKRITVRVPEPVDEWLEGQADALGVSKARLGGHCIDVHHNTVEHIDLQRSEYGEGEGSPGLRARVDRLEKRVEALESRRPLGSDREIDVGDVGPDVESDTTSGGEGNSGIDAVLADWSYGRDAEERAASEEMARRSLEWLRDQDAAVRKLDVPLDEWVDADPLDRSADTLWTQVVRAVWTEAIDEGVVEQPKARYYEWVGK